MRKTHLQNHRSQLSGAGGAGSWGLIYSMQPPLFCRCPDPAGPICVLRAVVAAPPRPAGGAACHVLTRGRGRRVVSQGNSGMFRRGRLSIFPVSTCFQGGEPFPNPALHASSSARVIRRNLHGWHFTVRSGLFLKFGTASQGSHPYNGASPDSI